MANDQAVMIFTVFLKRRTRNVRTKKMHHTQINSYTIVIKPLSEQCKAVSSTAYKTIQCTMPSKLSFSVISVVELCKLVVRIKSFTAIQTCILSTF